LEDCDQIEYKIEMINEKILPPGNDTEAKFSSFTVMFSDDQYVAYRRCETHGIVELMSIVGGLLGLFLGVSVLTVIEFFYFFTFRFVSDLFLQ
jgi:Amiloride-sensitive sodium channel